MSLSQVCKKYHFTRRVIQGYEKEGLIKHTGKNKYGYLMYNEEQVRKIDAIDETKIKLMNNTADFARILPDK